MIVRKILSLSAAAGFMTAAAGVFVIALAFALYAFARTWVGPAGASAIVAGAAALLMLLGALIALAASGFAKKKREPTMAERVKDFVQDKPIVAAVAALAAGFVAVRNPSLVTALVLGLLDTKSAKPKK